VSAHEKGRAVVVETLESLRTRDQTVWCHWCAHEAVTRIGMAGGRPERVSTAAMSNEARASPRAMQPRTCPQKRT
jgi:hypothetical protein